MNPLAGSLGRIADHLVQLDQRFAVIGGLAVSARAEPRLTRDADLVIAADDAYFGLPEIDRGAMGAASHAMRLFGVQAARYLLYTGANIHAEEAYRRGAVLDVVATDELHAAGRALARTIAEKSPRAIRLAKESLDGIEPGDLKRSYRFEQGFTYELYTERDSQEARNAFVEGRAAQFDDVD